MSTKSNSNRLYNLLKEAEDQVKSWQPWERQAMGLEDSLEDTEARAYVELQKRA